MSKVAAIQMCSSYDIDENLKTAAHWIDEAAQQGAKLIVLPENFAIMGKNELDKLAMKEPFGHGKIQSFLSEQAKKQGVWLVGGTIPMACEEENRVKAASLLFDDTGRCVARYDKMHLFDVTISDHESYKESATISPGNQMVVVDTPMGKLGLVVCYDIRFPELFRCLFNQGAEIFAIPAAFTVKTGAAHWEVLARSRAIENFCYVIGAGQGGVHANGRKTYGHSLIVEPWGKVVAEKPGTDSGVIYAAVDLEHLREVRNSIPVAQHQRWVCSGH